MFPRFQHFADTVGGKHNATTADAGETPSWINWIEQHAAVQPAAFPTWKQFDKSADRGLNSLNHAVMPLLQAPHFSGQNERRAPESFGQKLQSEGDLLIHSVPYLWHGVEQGLSQVWHHPLSGALMIGEGLLGTLGINKFNSTRYGALGFGSVLGHEVGLADLMNVGFLGLSLYDILAKPMVNVWDGKGSMQSNEKLLGTLGGEGIAQGVFYGAGSLLGTRPTLGFLNRNLPIRNAITGIDNKLGIAAAISSLDTKSGISHLFSAASDSLYSRIPVGLKPAANFS